jgi:hypothetical protein
MEELVQISVEDNQIKIVVFDPDSGEIIKWID